MACESSDNSIHVYRVDDGSLFQTLGGSEDAYTIAISPDEPIIAEFIIASANDQIIRLWDINNGSLLRTINWSVPRRTGITSLEFSPNSGILAAGTHKDIVLFQINDGTELLTIKDRNSEYISDMVFSPDGETLASGSLELRLSRVNDGKLLHKLNGVDHVRSLDFSPDGSILASGWQSPNVIRLWKISDGNLLQTLSEHIGDGVKALDLDFSPDGQLLASCGSDGTIRLWRVSDGTLLNTLKGCYYDVAFSPDGTILASVTDGKIWVWGIAP
jgi:WD40 repeat protein